MYLTHVINLFTNYVQNLKLILSPEPEPLQLLIVSRKLTKLAITAILASEALLREKKSSDTMLPPVGIEPRQPLILSPTPSFLHLLDMCCLGDL